MSQQVKQKDYTGKKIKYLPYCSVKKVYKNGMIGKKVLKYTRELLLMVVFLATASGCSSFMRISHGKVFIISRDVDREPNFLFNHKVRSYFNTWYSASTPLSQEDVNKLDNLSRLGYDLYEKFMADTSLLKTLQITNPCEYVIVPDKLEVSLIPLKYLTHYEDTGLDSLTDYGPMDSSANYIKDVEYSTIKITDFRPRIENRKCLYYTSKYRKHFRKFAEKYGVYPYVLIDSPLMYGGMRYFETSPYVYRIKICKDIGFVFIEYSSGTSDFGSIFKLENGKLKFIKHEFEMCVD
jgi:hypothetical protein